MPYLFEGFQTTLLAQIRDVVHNQLLDFGHVAEDRKCAGNTVFSCVVLDVLYIGNDHSYRARLEAFSVDKDLRNVLAFYVDVLNLLWSNIFTLRQLEDVLLAINDLQRSILFIDSVREKM